jgi:hypothetical protein
LKRCCPNKRKGPDAFDARPLKDLEDRLLSDGFLEFFRNAESNFLGSLDLDGFAGCRVATHAGRMASVCFFVRPCVSASSAASWRRVTVTTFFGAAAAAGFAAAFAAGFAAVLRVVVAAFAAGFAAAFVATGFFAMSKFLYSDSSESAGE